MPLRIFIIAATALLIGLETIFLPCEYVNKAMPYQPNAGYHTLRHVNTEMMPDMGALIYEAGVTLLLSTGALILAQRANAGMFQKRHGRRVANT